MRRLCGLAKLTLPPDEEEGLKGELSSVLDYFGVLDEAATGDIGLTVEDTGSPLRPDEVKETDPDPVLRCAPQKKGRLVRAPKVF